MTEDHRSESQHSVKEFAKEALHDLLHFDRKIFRSIIDLVFKPGLVTQSSVRDVNSKYIKPLGLFIFVNFLFFVFRTHGLFQYNLSAYQTLPVFKQHTIQKLQESKLSFDVFEAKFNTIMMFEQKSFFIFLIPFLALGMKLLYLNQRRYYVEHLVFSLHVFSFFLLYLIFTPIVYYLLFLILKIVGAHVHDNEGLLLMVVIPVTFWWVLIAAKKYYNESWLLTIIKSFVIVTLLCALIALVYRTVLFFVVLHAI